MQEILNATSVRKEFSQFVDSVVREKPRAVKRNRDVFLSLSMQHFVDVLANYSFAFEYEQEDDGTFVGSLLPLEDIIGTGATLDELIEDLSVRLTEYAEEYYESFNQYYNSPNRRSHLPYILKVVIQEDLEGVKKLIRG